MVTAVMKLKTFTPWEKKYDKPRQPFKRQSHYFVDTGLYSQSMVFPVIMYGFESWIIKKAERQRINAFELCCWKTLEHPLNCKDIKLVNPDGNQC